MPEPRRSELSSNATGLEPNLIERDSQIDVLLVQGLDLYFAGKHEEAIHVWTRVLFLDRSQPRARAYIDRARTALAERHRKAEELLHTSQQLLDRGETRAARDLLAQVVAATGDDERAAALRVQLERVERAHAWPAAVPASTQEIVPGWSWRRRSPSGATIFVAVIAVLATAAVSMNAGLRGWVASTSPVEQLTTAPVPAKLPILSSSDAALIRARTLYARGRLADALRALDVVSDQSPVRPDADALRVEIQRLLLATPQNRPNLADRGRLPR
jgi:thioredoxin-like negative regulator of GroEL